MQGVCRGSTLQDLPAATARRDLVIRPLEVEGDLLARRVGLALPNGPYRPAAAVAMVAVRGEVCASLRAEATAQARGARRPLRGSCLCGGAFRDHREP